MTKDELIDEINKISNFEAEISARDEGGYHLILIDLKGAHDKTFMALKDDDQSLSDVVSNWGKVACQNTDDIFTLLCLINRYVNTPLDQRNRIGFQEHVFGQSKEKLLEDKHNDNIRVLNGCQTDPSAGPTYELPQHGVIITLDDGQELHGKRAYRSLSTGDLSSVAIDFGNFIIPTAVIRSIQKCGDGYD